MKIPAKITDQTYRQSHQQGVMTYVVPGDGHIEKRHDSEATTQISIVQNCIKNNNELPAKITNKSKGIATSKV